MNNWKITFNDGKEFTKTLKADNIAHLAGMIPLQNWNTDVAFVVSIELIG